MSSGRDPFQDVIGHEGPKEFFRGVLRTGRVPSGFLLHGEAGRGKALFARALLLELLGTASSLENHPDIEVVAPEEGKVSIPIARLRTLKEWFSRAPFQASRRAALINDAQCLTVEAQNSLLKLLEEPPHGGLIVLVTPTPGALLETIHSRLQAVYFGPVAGPEAEAWLAQEARCSASEAAAALALTRGSPGGALALMADDDTRELLEAVPPLLASRPGPFEFAEELFKPNAMRVTALARTRCTRLFDFALEALAQGMAGRREAPVSNEDPLADWSFDDFQATVDDLIESKARIAANVTPRLVVEGLKIRIQRRHGRRRKNATR